MEEADYIDLNLHQFDIESKNYNILDSELNLFLQEIEMSVKMASGDVWGFVDAIDLNRYVFNNYITRLQVLNEVTTFIQNNCEGSQNFPWNVDVEFVTVNRKRMLLITVNVTKKNSEGIDETFYQKFFLDATKM